MDRKDIYDLIVSRCDELQLFLKVNKEVLCDDNPDEMFFSALIDHMNSLTGEINQNINGLKGYKYVSFMKKVITADLKTPLPDEEIANRETVFYRKRIVLTGNLLNFPSRQVVATILHKLGADINSSISARTQIVIMGESAGPSKIEKIKKYQDEGADIRVIKEPEFMELMKKYGLI